MDELQQNYLAVKSTIPENAVLVAVSKTYPSSKVEEVYQMGQRDFGENRVQELLEKHAKLPSDIRWHLIGHLQTNKVKFILPFVHLIQSVDRLKLMKKIQSEAEKLDLQIDVLLQLKVAQEDSKFGLDEQEFLEILKRWDEGEFPNVNIKGIMGMATFTDDTEVVRQEFETLRKIYKQYAQSLQCNTLSFGMSQDYKLALECGSNMVRIGSLIFGSRAK